jgi:hypothetical protein
MPKRGELIAFKPSHIPLFPDGIKWVKILVGVEGDRIEAVKVSPQDRAVDPQRYKATLFVNDMPVTVNIQGYVHLYPKMGKPLVMTVMETDTKYRKLPMIESQVIQHGKYFAYAPAPRSYDSRYWGFVDESWIVGKATPLR